MKNKIPVLIELMGAPSSGKTTLAYMLLAYLKRTYPDISTQYIQEVHTRYILNGKFRDLENVERHIEVNKELFAFYENLPYEANIIVHDSSHLLAPVYSDPTDPELQHSIAVLDTLLDRNYRVLRFYIPPSFTNYVDGGRIKMSKDDICHIDDYINELLIRGNTLGDKPFSYMYTKNLIKVLEPRCEHNNNLKSISDFIEKLI